MVLLKWNRENNIVRRTRHPETIPHQKSNLIVDLFMKYPHLNLSLHPNEGAHTLQLEASALHLAKYMVFLKAPYSDITEFCWRQTSSYTTEQLTANKKLGNTNNRSWLFHDTEDNGMRLCREKKRSKLCSYAEGELGALRKAINWYFYSYLCFKMNSDKKRNFNWITMIGDIDIYIDLTICS